MHNSNKLKIIALGIILIFSSSNSAAISGIHILGVSVHFIDTEIRVQIEINLTLPYEIYENDTKITNGTLFAYTVATIITPKNTTPGIINYGLFMNRTGEDFREYAWLNFSYGNLPLVPVVNITISGISGLREYQELLEERRNALVLWLCILAVVVCASLVYVSKVKKKWSKLENR